ncbi:MAG: pyrroline-5-carboxylate reductase [Candidatus Dadabacteria bacterium]|nr:MAG: pyrroline-5-carboxylate reductase [Candidatus Dadabacteria bacterium]
MTAVFEARRREASVKETGRIAFVGGGNMAEALVRGLVTSGMKAEHISVSDPAATRRRIMARRYGVRCYRDNLKAIEGAAVVVLAVKPQTMGAVLPEIGPALESPVVVVSIAAGVRLKQLESALPEVARVVRVMPNTPCLIGRGASVICPGSRARRTDVRRVERLLATVGKTFVVSDERLMDPVTGLSGSGPAYVYLFAEALIRGAKRAGLPESLARELCYWTLAGASAMLIETGRDPADLRRAVSSPGGTTVAGLAVLAARDFTSAVAEAVVAATKRSRELARGG